jgi:DNA-binding MarR family transcriptional regulator
MKGGLLVDYLKRWFDYTDRQLEMKEEIEQAILRADGSTLTLNEFLLLYFLKQATGHRLQQNELQDKLHLSASAISRMIAKLEAKNCGVIEKQACQTDKRAAYLVLTSHGEELLKRVLQEVEDSLAAYSEYLK